MQTHRGDLPGKRHRSTLVGRNLDQHSKEQQGRQLHKLDSGSGVGTTPQSQHSGDRSYPGLHSESLFQREKGKGEGRETQESTTKQDQRNSKILKYGEPHRVLQ